jgi:hypothetical protein
MTRSTSSGTAGAAVLWAAALRLASDVARHSGPAPSTGSAARASTDFGREWDALIGRWLGEEHSAAGSASDWAATFEYELDGTVLTHRAYGGLSLEAGGIAASAREALMTFFPREQGREAEAVRYDNAGQVLRVEAVWSDDGRSLAMTSRPEADEPRWRWTWRFEDADTLDTRLERASPGGGDFASQARGTLRRV